MSYGSRLLTNGEHDDLWRNAFKAVPELEDIFRTYANNHAIEVKTQQALAGMEYLKLLHKNGYYQSNYEEYVSDIAEIGSLLGYTIDKTRFLK